MTTRAQPRYASVEDAAIAAGGTMQTGDAPTTASHADAGRTDAVSALPPVVSRWLAHAPVVLALLACSTALSGPFLSWDDALYVTGNPRVQDTSWSGLVTLWSPEAALAGRFIEFFPLRDTLYWVLWALFGQNAVAFHALVVVLHAVATWRVAVLAQRMFSPRVAWTAAALFAVLPVHVESVAWIAALKDPLYTTCLLLAVEAHVQFRSTDRTRYLVASLVAVALGFLVKSLILVAPGVLLLVDWYLRVPWRKTLAVLVPHALVCALFLVPILAIAKANDVIATYPGGTLATGLMTTVLSYAIYLEKLCAPVGLNA